MLKLPRKKKIYQHKDAKEGPDLETILLIAGTFLRGLI
jgi:hypothetical protein